MRAFAANSAETGYSLDMALLLTMRRGASRGVRESQTLNAIDGEGDSGQYGKSAQAERKRKKGPRSPGPFICNQERSQRRALCGAFDETDDDQQNHRADQRIDDASYDAGQAKAQTRQQPSRNERADDADDDVADEAEAVPFHDHACKPSGDCADD